MFQGVLALGDHQQIFMDVDHVADHATPNHIKIIDNYCNFTDNTSAATVIKINSQALT